MNCEEAEKMVSDLVNGEADRSAGEPLREHLEGCPSCRRLQEEFGRIDELLKERGAATGVPEDYWGDFPDRVISRCGETEGAPGVSRAIFLATLAAAAVLVLALGGLCGWRLPGRHGGRRRTRSWRRMNLRSPRRAPKRCVT